MSSRHSLWLALFSLILSGSLRAQVSEKKAIEYAQHLSPSALDTTLPKGLFSVWLRRIVGQGPIINWEFNDCGEQTGDSAIDKQRDIPTCVEAQVTFPDSRRLGIMILVGTIGKGLVHDPVIWNISIESNGKYRTIKRLSDLPNVLKDSSR